MFRAFPKLVPRATARIRSSLVRSSNNLWKSTTTTPSRRLEAMVIPLSRRGAYRAVTVVDPSEQSRTSASKNLGGAVAAMVALLGLLATSPQNNNSKCESLTPAAVAQDDIDYITSAKEDDLPEYTAEEVAKHNGQDGTSVWMTYGGVVYDVTDFIANHPGGSEKIIMAAGSAIEPYWHLYRQHFATDLPMKLMEHMMIGRLAEKDQDEIDAQMEQMVDDPYESDPMRHASLKIHSDTPMNAELPSTLLTENYLTPPALFYIRHHHPVPMVKNVNKYRLSVDLKAVGIEQELKLSLEDIKKLPKHEVVATLQCSGNRRSGFNQVQRTSGTSWGQGAISTAKWGGVWLRDVLEMAGLQDAIEAQEKDGIEHVRFESLDGMSASIGIEKAMNPYGDVLLAYEMNDEPLPRDHGYPMRLIVPGYAAVRNVKWLNKIELAKTEAEGPWQRGLNYKVLPPSVTDAKNIQLDKMPSMTEVSLFSGITKVERIQESSGEVLLKVGGWAWSGGGRNIVRVDVTPDGGKTWCTAKFTKGSDQKFGRAWAWTFWECEVPAAVREDGTVELACKAVDMAFNVQPEKCDHMWNVRGLGNNSWYRTYVRLQ